MATEKGHLDKRWAPKGSFPHIQTNKFLFSEVVLLSQLREDTVIDKIPLTEIKMIREMMDTADEGQRSNGNEFMIETNEDGYNSGRTYYLQADSSGACRDVSNKILQNSKLAIERANAKTAFAQAQQQVRKFYNSAIFQNLVAFLILMVGMLIILKQLLISRFPFITFHS